MASTFSGRMKIDLNYTRATITRELEKSETKKMETTGGLCELLNIFFDILNKEMNLSIDK